MKAKVAVFNLPVAFAVLMGISAAVPAYPQSSPEIRKPAGHNWFLKQFTLESFGYAASSMQPGYEFESPITSGFYNPLHLECPLCVPGPAPFSRTRAVLPPFGGRIRSDFWNERLMVFASFGGIDGIVRDNTPRLNPSLWRATPNNDDWFVTSEAGSQIYMNSAKTVSVGFSKGHTQDFGPGQMRWGKTTGSVGLSPEVFSQLGRYLKRGGSR